MLTRSFLRSVALDAILRQFQQADDDGNRAEHEQNFVPSALVCQQRAHDASMTTNTSPVMWLSTA